MFKKFARWILADELREATWEAVNTSNLWRDTEMKLGIAQAQVEATNARFDELMAEHIRADLTIHKIKEATEGIKQGTAMKVHRIVSQYYEVE